MFVILSEAKNLILWTAKRPFASLRVTKERFCQSALGIDVHPSKGLILATIPAKVTILD